MFAPKGTRGGRVVVEQLDAIRWKVREEVRYIGDRDEFIIPAGYITDFATVPRFAVWLIPRFGLYTLAAILHDFLLTHCLRSGRISSRDADGLFRRAMRELGVPPARRNAMWTAVRWAALFNADRRDSEWWQDAPRVLAFTLLFSWLAIPMGVVALALIPWGLIEFVATLPSRRRTTAGSLST